jgi:hypothetical protein
MEERMKAIEQKNDWFGTFCKNILNAVFPKDGINQSKYSRLVIMDQEKALFSKYLPEFKGFRALRDNKYLVEKNYKIYSHNTAIQESDIILDNSKFSYIKFVYNFIYTMRSQETQMKIVVIDSNTLSKMKSSKTRTSTSGSLILLYLKKNRLEIRRNS